MIVMKRESQKFQLRHYQWMMILYAVQASRKLAQVPTALEAG
jgi:hypothetical protein